MKNLGTLALEKSNEKPNFQVTKISLPARTYLTIISAELAVGYPIEKEKEILTSRVPELGCAMIAC